MKKNQKQIYCMTGDSIESISGSPLVEKVLARGYEGIVTILQIVLYMTEPLDEYIFQAEFKFPNGIKLQHVGKAGLKFGDEGSFGFNTCFRCLEGSYGRKGN